MISLTQDEVIHNWNRSYTEPFVSICCVTYNHISYIEQCLVGFLKQKTDFPFEIIIHDDCSTDGTQEIIKEYAEKYPKIIKTILQEENQYSKGIRTILKTFIYPTCKGMYIAICEGDDYWTDENKLQKQVDFLESHKDYSACFHKAQVLSNGKLSDSVYDHLNQGDYDANSILNKWTIPTASFMFRSVYKDKVPFDKDFMYGDIVLFETAAQYGKLYCMAETMSVYRRVETGITGTQKKHRTSELYKRTDRHYKALKRQFPKISSLIIFKLRIKNLLFFILFILRGRK